VLHHARGITIASSSARGSVPGSGPAHPSPGWRPESRWRPDRLRTAAAQQVGRRLRFRERGRWSWRQVANILEHPTAPACARINAEQRQRVEGAPAGRGGPARPVSISRGGPRHPPPRVPARVAGLRDQKVPELQLLTVVRHAPTVSSARPTRIRQGPVIATAATPFRAMAGRDSRLHCPLADASAAGANHSLRNVLPHRPSDRRPY
jgi:hypothetical protein